MIRWIAKPIVWLSILGVLVALGYGTCFSFFKFFYIFAIALFLFFSDYAGAFFSLKKYLHLRNQSNSYSHWDEWLTTGTKAFWLCLAIVLAVIFFISLISLWALCGRIAIALALVHESSK